MKVYRTQKGYYYKEILLKKRLTENNKKIVIKRISKEEYDKIRKQKGGNKKIINEFKKEFGSAKNTTSYYSTFNHNINININKKHSLYISLTKDLKTLYINSIVKSNNYSGSEILQKIIDVCKRTGIKTIKLRDQSFIRNEKNIGLFSLHDLYLLSGDTSWYTKFGFTKNKQFNYTKLLNSKFNEICENSELIKFTKSFVNTSNKSVKDVFKELRSKNVSKQQNNFKKLINYFGNIRDNLYPNMIIGEETNNRDMTLTLD
jgi:hypothetical protein